MLHVGAGTDAPSLNYTAVYASNSGATAITARDSLNDVDLAVATSPFNGSFVGLFGTRTNHDLILQSNQQNHVVVKTTGSVGIGNLSPQAKLHVGPGADAPSLGGGWSAIYASNQGPTAITARDSLNHVDLTVGTASLGSGVFVGLFGTRTNHDLYLQSNSQNRIIISTSGTVGVGTVQAATSRLQVAGDLRFGSNGANTDLVAFTDAPTVLPGPGYAYQQVNTITPVTIPASGTTTHTAVYLKNATASGQGTNQIDFVVDGNIAAKYQDVAEWVPATVAMPAGTVVVLNGVKSNEVMPSHRSYDTTVAGVVSPQPGLLLGEAGPSKAKIATTGRVKIRVDATVHSIAIGDLLVTSEKAGLAMRSEPLDLGGFKIHRPGTLIGKALEPLAEGEGEILVLLSLQ
jgi:hypothetical protein